MTKIDDTTREINDLSFNDEKTPKDLKIVTSTMDENVRKS